MRKLDLHNADVWKACAPACGYCARNLAARAAASRSHVTRCSQRLFHRPPQKVFDTIRLLAAPDVLVRELSVKIAAAKLAYKQASQFSRDFRAFYGVFPRQYLALSHSEKVVLKVRMQLRIGSMTSLAQTSEPVKRQNWAPQIRNGHPGYV